MHRVMAKSAALSCECRGHAEAAARQAYLAGLGIAFRLRLDEERALEVLPAHASVREAAAQALLGRGPDRPVEVAAVDHREHRVEELLEVLEVDDLLGRELLDEPAVEGAVVCLDLAACFRVTCDDEVAV